MSVIRILPEHLANKIAAGEVIQRPESVVKELMENSVDASAKAVELHIKHAGKSLIQVIDDGIGMSEEDVKMSIQKHATSKISTLEDLERITTLGFRGEALSSIMSVAQIEIKTERREDEIGTLLRIEDSERIILNKGSFSKGTSIAVKNLFYNTPARRNFLKTDNTELKHVIDIYNKISLANPDLTFRMFLDGDLLLDYPAGTLSDRIGQIFFPDFLNGIIPVEEITDFMSIRGYVGKPSLIKKTRGDQYLFINKRFVNSRQINHAIFNAYENVLEKGDYPFFVLFLELDPAKIDVNIHPSKLEVRFDNEKDIYSFVVAVIKRSLGNYDLISNISFRSPTESRESLKIDKIGEKAEFRDFGDRPKRTSTTFTGKTLGDDDIERIFGGLNLSVEEERQPEAVILPFEQKMMESIAEPEKKEQDKKTPFFGDEIYSPFIVQLQNKYILTQIRSGLMIVDQHAAHERILYEEALKKMKTDLPFSQPLLFSKTIQLDPGTYKLVQELYPHLQRLGFTIKFFSKHAIVIDGIPADVKMGDEEKIILEIIEEYLINQREKNILEDQDNLAKSYSCKTAIRTGDRLSEDEMHNLIDRLFATSMPYVCPHGRPIVAKLTIDEFDRRFGRT
ncbi:MAG: DNA mismatch repair endonuclease MutL [Ignavibacteriaceae bacterium]|nr:DNA mismatch repair endonuclease MutL [Ignavibacteriaceae bacterium]